MEAAGFDPVTGRGPFGTVSDEAGRCASRKLTSHSKLKPKAVPLVSLNRPIVLAAPTLDQSSFALKLN
jgi:hypothetical protein